MKKIGVLLLVLIALLFTVDIASGKDTGEVNSVENYEMISENVESLSSYTYLKSVYGSAFNDSLNPGDSYIKCDDVPWPVTEVMFIRQWTFGCHTYTTYLITYRIGSYYFNLICYDDVQTC